MIPPKSLVYFAKSTLNSQRCFGISCTVFRKVSDPIQQLFLEQIKEYRSKASGGKMIDSDPQIEQEKKNELERVAKQFGGGIGTDMTKFPEFRFEDPKIDAVTQ